MKFSFPLSPLVGTLLEKSLKGVFSLLCAKPGYSERPLPPFTFPRGGVFVDFFAATGAYLFLEYVVFWLGVRTFSFIV